MRCAGCVRAAAGAGAGRGQEFFSNGIHLHDIEAAQRIDGDSAADASWRAINAIDDVALEILTLTDRVTVAALQGNAGAGGCFLALAADEVWAHEGVVLNPHYKNMGNLYGSEYWTYSLPRRIGEAASRAVMQQRLPLVAPLAVQRGLLDACFAVGAAPLWRRRANALALAAAYDLPQRLQDKARRRAEDEARKPLARYREEELQRMQRNFYGFDPSYHVARHHFVYRKPHAWTPRHLAPHRDIAPCPRPHPCPTPHERARPLRAARHPAAGAGGGRRGAFTRRHPPQSGGVPRAHGSADEARGLLEQHEVSVILCDQRMPGTTGVRFLKEVRELWPDTVRIIISGYTDSQDIIAGINERASTSTCSSPGCPSTCCPPWPAPPRHAACRCRPSA
jgi:enoyl-CoA hydratase/carnithine racemase